MKRYLLVLGFFLTLQFLNAQIDDEFDVLGTPKCENGQTNCKRVSDRRKKKQKQKETAFFSLPKDDPEQQKIDRMMEWLKQGSVELPKMDIVYFHKNFRGAVATRKIYAGDTVLFVPKSHLMTYESSVDQSSMARRLLAKKVSLLNARHTVVAFHILEEKEKPNSFWKPYLDMFPDNYYDFPLFYGEKDFEMLQNSSFKEDVKYQQKEFKNDYQKIVEQIPEFEFFSYEEFAWARLAVQSRIFGISVDGEQTQAMVPFADMLNHARVHPTEWTFNQQREAFVITAKSDIEKGTEIYDTYGRKTNRVFYTNYGFLEDGNDLNVADAYVCLNETDRLYHSKLRLLNQQPCIKFRINNSTQDQSFYEAISIARVLSTNRIEIFLQLERRIETRSYTKAPPINIETELKALKYLTSLLIKQLDYYPTTIEEDIQLIAQEKSWALKNILVLRKLEKELLRETVEKIQDLINFYEQPIDITVLEQRIDKKELALLPYATYLKTIYIPLQKGEPTE